MNRTLITTGGNIPEYISASP